MTAAGAVRTGRTLPSSRSWAPVLAWGAGLIQSAMGAAVLIGAPSTPAARVAAGVVFALGLAALAWGGASLARGRLVAPTAALTTALVGVGAGGLLLTLSAGRSSVYALAASTVVLVVLGAVCAIARRDRRHPPSAVSIPALLIAATVIALLVTPALGTVQDAALLRDDGTFTVVDPHGGH